MKKRIKWESLLIIAIALWLSLSYVFMWPPVCMELVHLTPYDACSRSAQIIESGKENWALENGMDDGTEVPPDVVAHWRDNGLPVCPNSGSPYTLNPIGSNAPCSEPVPVPATPKKKRVGLFLWQWSQGCGKVQP